MITFLDGRSIQLRDQQRIAEYMHERRARNLYASQANIPGNKGPSNR